MKRTEWTEKELIPSLLVKFQNRNIKYDTIVVSEKQAEMLKDVLTLVQCIRPGAYGYSHTYEKRLNISGEWYRMTLDAGKYNKVCFITNSGKLANSEAQEAEEAKKAEKAHEVARENKIAKIHAKKAAGTWSEIDELFLGALAKSLGY